MSDTANLKLPLIVGSQDGAITNHDTSMFILDALVNGRVIDRDLTAPPAAVLGDVYIPAASATGVWTGLDDLVVVYDGAGWKSYTPKEGWTFWVNDENVRITHDGTSWKTFLGEAVIQCADHAGNQTVNGSQLAILWDTETRKDGNVFTHSTSSNKDQIVVKEAGWYEVTYNVGVRVTATNGQNTYNSRVTLNGSAVADSGSSADLLYAGTTLRCNMNATVLINCAANDIIRIEVVRASGSSTSSTLAEASRVRIRRI